MPKWDKKRTKWEQETQSGTTRTPKWDKNEEQSGIKNPQSGTRRGTKWEQEPQSGTSMKNKVGTRTPKKKGNKVGTRTLKWGKKENKVGTRTPK